MTPQQAAALVGHSPPQPEAGSGAVAPPIDPAAEDIVGRLRARAALWMDEADDCTEAAGIIEHLRADVSAFSFQHTLDNEEIGRLLTALRAVRACTDASWAAQIISDALRETA